MTAPMTAMVAHTRALTTYYAGSDLTYMCVVDAMDVGGHSVLDRYSAIFATLFRTSIWNVHNATATICA